MKTKITKDARERIQRRLEKEVKNMTWKQRVKHLTDVTNVYLAELSNHYDDAMQESQYLRNHYFTDDVTK